jgi:hypothetical protein
MASSSVGEEVLAVTFMRLRTATPALMSLVLLTACGLLDSGNRIWSEEVELEDGSIITIDRHVEQLMSDAIGGGAFSATETKSILSFRAELAALPSWDVALMPLLLYRDPATSEWVIVATTTSCEIWNARGSPEARYWEFRLRGSEWVEVPNSESSFERKTNLLFEYTQPLPSEHITLATKARLQSGDQAQMFRVIQRGVRMCQRVMPR